MTTRRRIQWASKELGSEPVRAEWSPKTVALVCAAKHAFDRQDMGDLQEAWVVAAHSICDDVIGTYDQPVLTVDHRKATKTTAAKYNWWLDEGRARIQLDFTRQLQFGWERHASDFAHELCHHIDIWVFGLEDTYHTRAFYMRSTVLALKLLAAVK